MTNQQVSRLNMYLAVKNVCMQFDNTWQQVPITVKCYEQFISTIKEIQASMQKQQLVSTGFTKEKNALRNSINERMNVLIASLTVWADMKQDISLSDQVNITSSDIQHLPEVVFNEQMKMIVDIAGAYVQELEDYGITEAFVNELQLDVDTFGKMLGTPRVLISRRKNATDQLKVSFKEADQLLRNRLDKLFLHFKGSEFMNAYKNARNVIPIKRYMGSTDVQEAGNSGLF